MHVYRCEFCLEVLKPFDYWNLLTKKQKATSYLYPYLKSSRSLFFVSFQRWKQIFYMTIFHVSQYTFYIIASNGRLFLLAKSTS